MYTLIHSNWKYCHFFIEHGTSNCTRKLLLTLLCFTENIFEMKEYVLLTHTKILLDGTILTCSHQIVSRPTHVNEGLSISANVSELHFLASANYADVLHQNFIGCCRCWRVKCIKVNLGFEQNLTDEQLYTLHDSKQRWSYPRIGDVKARWPHNIYFRCLSQCIECILMQVQMNEQEILLVSWLHSLIAAECSYYTSEKDWIFVPFTVTLLCRICDKPIYDTPRPRRAAIDCKSGTRAKIVAQWPFCRSVLVVDVAYRSVMTIELKMFCLASKNRLNNTLLGKRIHMRTASTAVCWKCKALWWRAGCR